MQNTSKTENARHCRSKASRKNHPADAKTAQQTPGSSKVLREKFANAILAGDQAQIDQILREIARLSPPADWPDEFFRLVTSLLAQAAHCVIEQKAVQEKLRCLALTDDMTGLNNRRGFLALADQQLKLARRNHQCAVLFFVDIDGLKQINDHFGHAEGNVAIRRAAQILKKTFRHSDVVARLGGDEFAILAIGAESRCENDIWRRLNENLSSEGERNPLYTLSLSIGSARFDPHSAVSLDDLLNYADRAMYEAKRGSRDARLPGKHADVLVRNAASALGGKTGGDAVAGTKSPRRLKGSFLYANFPIPQGSVVGIKGQERHQRGGNYGPFLLPA